MSSGEGTVAGGAGRLGVVGAIIAIAPVALVVGFLGAEDARLGVGALAFVVAILVFLVVPFSFSLKLIFSIIALTFIQRSVGYLRSSGVQGLNVGNICLLLGVGYWFIRGLQSGKFYRPTGIDFPIVLAFLVIPVFSIYYVTAFRRVPGYSFGDTLRFFKQYATPIIYFFLLCQCLERKKEVVYLLGFVLGLLALAVVLSLPETLRLTSWREERTEGFVSEPNRFGALISMLAPFPLLILFMKKDRPILRIVILCGLAAMAFSLLSTYSRSGYVGFALALALSVYVAYRGTGSFPIAIPALVIGSATLLPLALAPQLVDFIRLRFEVKTYKRAKRQSYSRYGSLNQYSGDRLDIWNGAIAMSRENPFLGKGFETFELELPKYHPDGIHNMPHNHFLGTLAQGGVVWLMAMLYFLWKLFRFLYLSWKVTLAEGDIWGQIICGGAFVGYFVMLWISLTLDFYHPGPQILFFWVMLAGAVKYVGLAGEPAPARAASPVPVAVAGGTPSTSGASAPSA